MTFSTIGRDALFEITQYANCLTTNDDPIPKITKLNELTDLLLESNVVEALFEKAKEVLLRLYVIAGSEAPGNWERRAPLLGRVLPPLDGADLRRLSSAYGAPVGTFEADSEFHHGMIELKPLTLVRSGVPLHVDLFNRLMTLLSRMESDVRIKTLPREFVEAYEIELDSLIAKDYIGQSLKEIPHDSFKKRRMEMLYFCIARIESIYEMIESQCPSNIEVLRRSLEEQPEVSINTFPEELIFKVLNEILDKKVTKIELSAFREHLINFMRSLNEHSQVERESLIVMIEFRFYEHLEQYWVSKIGKDFLYGNFDQFKASIGATHPLERFKYYISLYPEIEKTPAPPLKKTRILEEEGGSSGAGAPIKATVDPIAKVKSDLVDYRAIEINHFFWFENALKALDAKDFDRALHSLTQINAYYEASSSIPSTFEPGRECTQNTERFFLKVKEQIDIIQAANISKEALFKANQTELGDIQKLIIGYFQKHHPVEQISPVLEGFISRFESFSFVKVD